MKIELQCSCGARFEYQGDDCLYMFPVKSTDKVIDWPRESADAFKELHKNCVPLNLPGSAP